MYSQDYCPFGTNTPCLQSAKQFNALEDADILMKAMKGFGTDNQAIIHVLARRGFVQRQEILESFQYAHGKDLLSELKSELGGNFEDVIMALMTPLPQFYAKELHDAIARLGTDKDAIIEILCTFSLSNFGLLTVLNFYESEYNSSLESDLIKDASQQFSHLLGYLCKAERNEDQIVDTSAARSEAAAIIKAREQKQWKLDKSLIIAILASQSCEQLKKIFLEYKEQSGQDIESDIETEFCGDIQKALLAIVKCVKSKVDFFAERLYASMAGLGTSDKTLIRIIVSRSEIDLGDIKTAFQKNYGESLASFISGDTSGDYRKVLLTLVGP